MAELTIRWIEGAEGPRLAIDLVSDRDVLPHEHEIDHRAMAAGLLGMTVAEVQALGIEVRRVTRGQQEAEPPRRDQSAERARERLPSRNNPGRRR